MWQNKIPPINEIKCDNKNCPKKYGAAEYQSDEQSNRAIDQQQGQCIHQLSTSSLWPIVTIKVRIKSLAQKKKSSLKTNFLQKSLRNLANWNLIF